MACTSLDILSLSLVCSCHGEWQWISRLAQSRQCGGKDDECACRKIVNRVTGKIEIGDSPNHPLEISHATILSLGSVVLIGAVRCR
jgi:hypothetical protein